MTTRPSLLTAGILTLLAVGWMLSGQLSSGDNTPKLEPQYQEKTTNKRTTKVRIRNLQAQEYVPTARVTGQTASSRSLIIRTQIAGKISKIKVQHGENVNKGDIIAELNAENLPQRLKEARARVRQRELEFSAAKNLALKGFKAETKYAAAFADLQKAVAHEKRIEIDNKNTVIRAPFKGILTKRHVEVGDVLKKSAPVANLIDLDPLLISAFVSERDYLKLRKGQRAQGLLMSGKKIEGHIRYISPVAQKATRTFKIELETPNPGNLLVEGITAELILPLAPVFAHQLSAALFSLNSSGELGVKIVNKQNKVEFIPIQIVGGTNKKVFVTGMPDKCKIITVGQGFVTHNEIVESIAEDSIPGRNQ